MFVVEHRILPGSIFDRKDFYVPFFLFEENRVKACPAHDNAAFKRHFMHGYSRVLKMLRSRRIFGAGSRIESPFTGSKPVQFNWN